MTNLLTLPYWFAQLPFPFIPVVFYGLLAIFGIFVIVGVVLNLVAKRKHASLYWRDGYAFIAANLFQTGLVGLVLVWLTEEQVGFFGMRFWFPVLAVAFLVRLAFTVKRMVKDLPPKAAAFAEHARIEKYLPH